MNEDKAYYTADVARWRSLKNGDKRGRIQRKIWDRGNNQYTEKIENKWISFDLSKDSPTLVEQELTGNKVLDEKVWREFERE